MTDRYERVTPARGIDAEWDEFVASLPGDTLSQSSAYAVVKESTHLAHRIKVRREGKIIAGMQILSRRVGPGPAGSVGYVAKGPLLHHDAGDVAPAMMEQAIHLSNDARIRVLVVQTVDDDARLDNVLETCGFGPSPTQVATTGTIAVDLSQSSDDLLAAMRSGLRRNIRKAERSGVVVRSGTKDDLRHFYEMHLETAERNAFTPISWHRLETEWDVLHPLGHFELFLTEHDGITLSGATVTAFGDRALFRTAGWFRSTESAALRPNDLLHWHIMSWAKDAGYRFYDLGGFDRSIAQALLRGEEPPPEFRATYSHFKLGYGGKPLVLPRSIWLVIPRLLRPFQRPMRYALENVPAAQRALAKRHNA